MKKFTLLAIAALVSVVAFAQKRNFSVADAKQVSRTSVQQPTQQKVVVGLTAQKNGLVRKVAAKRAPMKAASVDELVGKFMSISAQYVYDSDAQQLVDASVPMCSYATTITKVDETTIAFTGLMDGNTEPIEATVDLENGTFTIEPNQVLFTSSYGPVLMGIASDEDVFTGVFYEEGLEIDQPWVDYLGGDGEYAGYLWTGYYYSTFMTLPNGSMSWENASANIGSGTEDVYIYQDEENHVATVFGFVGMGFVVDIDLLEDNAFTIPYDQLLEEGGTTYGDYYPYAVIDDNLGVITGVGTDTQLTIDGDWTIYSTTGYWYNVFSATTIKLTEGTFAYPVVEDVAAVPANPEIVYIGVYDAEYEYGPVYFDVPDKDVDGNDLKKSKLYYQFYSNIDGTIAPITFTPDLYKNLDEDMTEVPYNFSDNYDFDSSLGHKRVWLNWDYSNFDYIGIKSIYYGGDERNETEIQWLDIAALRQSEAIADAQDVLEEEIENAKELLENEDWTVGLAEFQAAIADAEEVNADEAATLEQVEAATVALQQAEEAFKRANMTPEEYATRSFTWIASEVYADVETSEEVTDFIIDENISGLFAKGTGTTAPQYYTNGGAVRFYKGNTLTISAGKNVEKIKKIQIGFTSTSNAKATSCSEEGYVQSGTLGTWEGSAKEITFTNAQTGSGHSRISALLVTYQLTEEAVGIKNVETAQKTVGGIYNLQGQRMTQMPQKGLYIMDGKKVVIK